MPTVEKMIVVLLKMIAVLLRVLSTRTNKYEIAFKIARLRGELTELFGMLERVKNEKRASAKAPSSYETEFVYESDYQFKSKK